MKIHKSNGVDQLDGIPISEGELIQIIWPDGVVQRVHTSVDSGHAFVKTAYRGVKLNVVIEGLEAERVK